MHSHPTEIMAEAWLEVVERRRIERLPRRAKHLMHEGGCLVGDGFRPSRLLLEFFRLLAGGTFAAGLRRCGRDGDAGSGHAHYLVGDTVRLVLQWVIDGADFEFWL